MDSTLQLYNRCQGDLESAVRPVAVWPEDEPVATTPAACSGGLKTCHEGNLWISDGSSMSVRCLRTIWPFETGLGRETAEQVTRMSIFRVRNGHLH